MSEAIIPDLPEGLRFVPRGSAYPNEPGQEARAVTWTLWRAAVAYYRAERWIATDPEINLDTYGQERETELVRCQKDPVYFITVWCQIHEPRPDEPMPGWNPCIPYAFQVDLIRKIEQIMLATRQTPDVRPDLAVSKSRDMGATWFICLYVLWGWLFQPTFSGKLISRREDLVDGKTADSMFGRILPQIDPGIDGRNTVCLPDWLRPPNWTADDYRFKNLIQRPDSGNEIQGESTTAKSGRGGRCSLAVVDEAAFIDAFGQLWGTLTSTTTHRIAVSSESVEATEDFYKLRTGKMSEGAAFRPEVLELDWWLHPLHGQDWLDYQRSRFPDEASFNREVLRDPNAGFGMHLYEKAKEIVPGDFPWEEGMPLWACIDPGFDDETACHIIGRSGNRYRMVQSFAFNHRPPEFYACLLFGGNPTDADLQSFDWPEHVEQLAAELAHFPRLRAIYGDPAGANRTTGEKDSFYTRMLLWREKRNTTLPPDRQVRTPIDWKTEDGARNYTPRRYALMNLLGRLDFHNTPQVVETLRCVRESRFETTARPRMGEQKTPRHDEKYHRVAALEYFAVNIDKLADLDGYTATPGKARRAKRAA